MRRFFTPLRQQPDRKSGIKVAQGRCSMAVFEHHALSKTGGGVFVTQARKGLDGVEIKLLPFDDLLQSEIKANGSLINHVALGCGAEQLLQTWLKFRDLFRGDFFRFAYEFGRITRVDIHSTHSHPLGWIVYPTSLTHAPPAERAHGTTNQQAPD